MAKRDIYIAIMIAAAKGRGLPLSADELYDLSRDDAISAYAANGLDSKDWADPLNFPLVGRTSIPIGSASPETAKSADFNAHNMWPTS